MARLNAWPEEEARAGFLRCCGSPRWADAMTACRPFRDEAELFARATEFWRALPAEEWLAAFAAHPKIGERSRPASWSAAEQAGVASAGENVLESLAQENRNYEAKFGFIFIVCASGKSAGEMLTLLRQRLLNDRGTELRVAAGEQEKIARLRLEKLCP